MVNREFYSKILLFGEYSVICNSMGLTVPYKKYSGSFKKGNILKEDQLRSSESLKKFHTHLLKLADQNELLANLDLNNFKKDLNHNLFFDSNIPQGYGVGSSGALCAAVYDVYCQNKVVEPDNNELPGLKKIFSQMESYFHGVSSGLDPLNSYLNKTLLIKNKETLDVVDKPGGFKDKELITFLVDTKQSSETDQLVHIFFDKCRQYRFYKEVKNNLIPLNNQCIQLFMQGDLNGFLDQIRKLSIFFLENFKPMIPNDFFEIWNHGINDSSYSLKLCGSGGGGFLLGFTTDIEAIKGNFKGYSLYKLEI